MINICADIFVIKSQRHMYESEPHHHESTTTTTKTRLHRQLSQHNHHTTTIAMKDMATTTRCNSDKPRIRATTTGKVCTSTASYANLVPTRIPTLASGISADRAVVTR